MRLIGGLIPLSPPLFGHPALVTFLPKLAFLLENFSLGGYLFKNVGGGVVDDGFACEGGGDPLLDELHYLDVAYVSVLGDGDF